MENIQMVDLRRQYLRIKEEVDAAISNVLKSSRFIKGPEVGDFERGLEQYLGVDHVIGCGNGTDALQIALMALDLEPGDEVITSNFGFIATVETVALLGFKPVLVEADPYTFNIDPKAISKALSSRTKAIIPVHLFGQCADMKSIMEIAKSNNLVVIEDAAQAIGAEYRLSDGSVKKAGTIGDIGTTSFFPSKNLGCYGDGGAILTNNTDLSKRMRSIASHGFKIKYSSHRIGINSRLDTIQAAILKVKLKYLESYNQSRQEAALYYDEKLKEIDWLAIPARVDKTAHIFHQYTLKVKGSIRSKLREHLDRNGIPTMIYYPVPMHLQEALSYLSYEEGQFPISTELCQSVVSLPMHTELDESQLHYIADRLKGFVDS